MFSYIQVVTCFFLARRCYIFQGSHGHWVLKASMQMSVMYGAQPRVGDLRTEFGDGFTQIEIKITQLCSLFKSFWLIFNNNEVLKSVLKEFRYLTSF